MKNFLRFIALILSGAVLVSCTDDFTEQDAMEALQKISLQIAVHDASDSDAALEGAQIKAVIDTSVVTVTTGATGIGVFENIKIGGNINVYVSKDGYTTAFTSINTTPNDYRQTVVSGNVDLYSLSGNNVATFKGQLTIETDLTNRQREYVSDTEILLRNSSLSYTSQYFVGTTDATGNYSVEIPVNSEIDNYVYVYLPVLEKQRTAGESVNNVYSVKTKTATYSPTSYSPTTVASVPSALIEIAAPPASGTGFQLGLKAERTALSAAINNETYDEVIITGGTGYDGIENFVFAADPDGNQAELNVTVNASGVITGVTIVDNGATYSSMPAIVTNPANGSGAKFDFRFRYWYKVYIADSGSGYLSFPRIGMEYTSAPDYTSKLKKEYDPDVTILDSYAVIREGEIKNSGTNGDTLYNSYYYSEPVFTYSEEDRSKAIWYAYASAINTSDSTLNDDFYFNIQGDGYDFENPPVVTVTALAGYGSGAVVKSEVNPNGAVSDLVVMVKGTGYTRNINDYDGDGFSETGNAEMTGFYSWGTGYGSHNNVKPGRTYTGDVFYGTGRVKEQ